MGPAFRQWHGTGRVAVNRRGTRLGKGAGYSDIEVALLQEAGLIGPSTVIVTTVHPLQVIDEVMPETEYDFSVDLIATPGEVIECVAILTCGNSVRRRSGAGFLSCVSRGSRGAALAG